MPKIITYTTADPEAPASMRAAAAMVPDGPGTHWLATGPTEEAARAKLEVMLLPATERAKAKRAAKAPTTEPVAQAPQPVGEVI